MISPTNPLQNTSFQREKKESEMASMSTPKTHLWSHKKFRRDDNLRPIKICIVSQQKHHQEEPSDEATTHKGGRRELILRSNAVAILGAIFHFSGPKPNYLGVQKNPAGLALCPATKNCVSTSENISDLAHYAPPWTYNPKEGRGSKKPVSREEAVEELIQVIESTKPDNYSPKIAEKKGDYIRVEYESPLLGLVDDVEFWFPPGKKSIVQYRSASRIGNFDFDINRKRIKALRVALEKKGWSSENTF